MSPRNECVDRVLEELERYGLQGTVSERGKHLEIAWQYRDGQQRQTFVPKTASDWRSSLNARGDVRKTLRADGIQLPASTIVTFQKAMSLPKLPIHGLTREQALQKDVDALIDLVFELGKNLSETQERLDNMKVTTTVSFAKAEVVPVVEAEQAPQPKRKVGAMRQKVLDQFQGGRWVSRGDVIKAVGKGSDKVVSNHLLRLRKEGIIELGQRAQYRLNPAPSIVVAAS